MANTDRANGFTPTRALVGEHGRTNSYNVTAANARIAPGDLVSLQNDGTINKSSASDTQIVGVAAEVKAASSGGTCLVYDNPFQVFVAQTDNGTGTMTAQTGVTLNANFVDTATTTDRSIMEIDESSATTNNTLPLKGLRLYPAVDNALGEFNRLEVIINNHVLKSVGVAAV